MNNFISLDGSHEVREQMTAREQRSLHVTQLSLDLREGELTHRPPESQRISPNGRQYARFSDTGRGSVSKAGSRAGPSEQTFPDAVTTRGNAIQEEYLREGPDGMRVCTGAFSV